MIVKSAKNVARSLGKPPKNTGSNVSSGIYAPTGSQLHTLQHGADMCKLNGLNHSFGQNYDTDDTIYEYLCTYGMKPAASSSACLNGKLKPVEICLQVEGDLTQNIYKEARDNDTSTKSKPLEATDIEHNPTLIADLKRSGCRPTSRLLQGNDIGNWCTLRTGICRSYNHSRRPRWHFHKVCP